jgi:hypothetical protein
MMIDQDFKSISYNLNFMEKMKSKDFANIHCNCFRKMDINLYCGFHDEFLCICCANFSHIDHPNEVIYFESSKIKDYIQTTFNNIQYIV